MAKTLSGLDGGVSGLDGKPLQDPEGKVITVKSLISNSIARGQSKEPARAMVVAMSIYSADGKVELEDADCELAKKAVEEDQFLNNMAKAAALGAFD